jgi:signal transduction histidine kinase
VVVGDTPLDERVTALVAAAREAVVNAARHSGAPAVDVYAEVEPGLVSAYVRDRGCGFDRAAVPADRHGLTGSVEGRMARHGGTAVVRSAPGQGTEVRLELPTVEAGRRSGG